MPDFDPTTEPKAYLVTLFIALEQMKEKAPEGHAKDVAITDLERLIAWIGLYLNG